MCVLQYDIKTPTTTHDDDIHCDNEHHGYSNGSRRGTHLASLAGEGSEVEAGSWLAAHFAQLIHSAEGREEIHYYWVVTTTSCCRKLTVKSLGEIDVNRARLRRGSCRGDASVMSSGDVFRQSRSPPKTSGSLLNNTVLCRVRLCVGVDFYVLDKVVRKFSV